MSRSILVYAATSSPTALWRPIPKSSVHKPWLSSGSPGQKVPARMTLGPGCFNLMRAQVAHQLLEQQSGKHNGVVGIPRHHTSWFLPSAVHPFKTMALTPLGGPRPRARKEVDGGPHT